MTGNRCSNPVPHIIIDFGTGIARLVLYEVGSLALHQIGAKDMDKYFQRHSFEGIN